MRHQHLSARNVQYSDQVARQRRQKLFKEVFVGPVGSIGFAPWPWITLRDLYILGLEFRVSVKPFKEINWTVSVELVGPFAGINPAPIAT